MGGRGWAVVPMRIELGGGLTMRALVLALAWTRDEVSKGDGEEGVGCRWVGLVSGGKWEIGQIGSGECTPGTGRKVGGDKQNGQERLPTKGAVAGCWWASRLVPAGKRGGLCFTRPSMSGLGSWAGGKKVLPQAPSPFLALSHVNCHTPKDPDWADANGQLGHRGLQTRDSGELGKGERLKAEEINSTGILYTGCTVQYLKTNCNVTIHYIYIVHAFFFKVTRFAPLQERKTQGTGGGVGFTVHLHHVAVPSSMDFPAILLLDRPSILVEMNSERKRQKGRESEHHA